ncbi:MAG TPA: efflux RND transporter periplasmic adaptor subunit [Bryobacterales bacterium]|nr:efflux RND transporter periplasmic adaptor subunit [Bryobacterales bacterium]
METSVSEKKTGGLFTTRRVLVIVAVLAAATLLGAFARSRRKEPVYFTSTVEKGDIRSEVTATGTINAVITVQVGSQVSGVIDKLFVDFNDKVHKGQVVAQIDQSIFKAQVAQAEADLENAKANVNALAANIDAMRADLASSLANVDKAVATENQAKLDRDRNADLFRQGIVAAAVRDQAQSTYEAAAAATRASRAAAEQSKTKITSAIAQLAQAKAQVQQKAAALQVSKVNLAYTTIYTPVDGTVVARNVDVGQTVAASLQAPTLYTIAQDLKRMLVYAKTDESDVGNIRQGALATFKVDAFPKETFSGSVSQIRMNPQTIQNVVTYDTVIAFDNPDEKLLPGMTAYVTIPVASARNVIKVPNGALRFRLEEPERQALFAKYNFKNGPAGRPGMAPQGAAAAGGGAGKGAASGGPGGSAPGGGRGGWNGGGGRGAGVGPGGGSGSAGGAKPRGPSSLDIKTLYVLQPDKTLRPVVVRTGITDYTFTEVAAVLQGEIKPGEEVVNGKELPNRGISGFGGPMGRGMGRR